jgi:hypothetical protein
MTTEIVHAAPRRVRLKTWLSRDGQSILLAVPGAEEPLRFQGQEPESVPSGPGNWEVLDRVLRSWGK